MDQPTSYADHMQQWQRRLSAMAENAEDLVHLESRRDKLQGVLDRAITVFQIQAAAAATKQEATRELETLIADGRMVMTFLNAGLREHYGKDSEKLAEFHIAPFRGRRPTAAKPEPPPPPTLPEDVR
ncbi:MAG TPA: hypothetical protein VN493_05040 [Thermoanaerobaculia bacterium]|nr:hypothetical protein [Thermoanaerobaculia bacterium]